MSNIVPKTTTDNKNKEELEDSECSGVPPSKKQTFKFGVNPNAIPNSDTEAPFKKLNELESANDVSESGDSGFIAELQTHASIHEENGAVGGDCPSLENVNVIDKREQQKYDRPIHNKGLEKVILDSGCIDEESCMEDNNKVSIKEEKCQLNEPPKQVQREHLSISAAGAIPKSAEQKISKKNVNAEISKMISNLSLDAKAKPHLEDSSDQYESQQTLIKRINDLNTSRRRKAVLATQATQILSSTNSSSTQQKEDTGSDTSIPKIIISDLSDFHACEYFYRQDENGDTLLHNACLYSCDDAIVNIICQAPHPCLLNIQNDSALTPLHLAAVSEESSILRTLLIAGSQPTVRDNRGNTALHIACIVDNVECVRALTIPISEIEINKAHARLLKEGASIRIEPAHLPSDLEITNYEGRKCVHIATQNMNTRILKILVYYGADINARERKAGYTPLHMAIEIRDEKLINFLINECPNINLETLTYGRLTAYQFAGLLNDTQRENVLVKSGAEPLPPPSSDCVSSDDDFENVPLISWLEN